MIKIKYYNIYSIKDILKDKLPCKDYYESMKIVAKIIPFRVNNFVVDELIDWSNVPNDPIFRITFPHKELLKKEHYDILEKSDDRNEKEVLKGIRNNLNPHPSGQRHNIPIFNGRVVKGVQHKYDETILLFPREGQTCHSYCNFCFRWPQFIGENSLKFETSKDSSFIDYIKQNKVINDILLTGGDPMMMTAEKLSTYISPFLTSDFEHIKTIRIGSKSLTYWPFRYLSDKDSIDLLRLYERIVQSGKHLAFMAHFNHWRELENEYVIRAIKKIQATGAIIRSQSPILRNINNDSTVWEKMWKRQYQLGVIPYYMFVERDTGADHYYSLPLIEAYEVFSKAISNVSGLCRTVRGPSMSAEPGKVNVAGIATVNNEKYFVLEFLQAKDSSWVNVPFLAKYNKDATWLDQLEPAFSNRFMFE